MVLAQQQAIDGPLPLPVIGRIEDGALVLDLRCLEQPAKLTGSLRHLRLP